MKIIRKVEDKFEAEQFIGQDHPLPFAGRGDPCQCDDGDGIWACQSPNGLAYGLKVGDWVIRCEDADGYVAFEAWTDENFKDIWQEVKA